MKNLIYKHTFRVKDIDDACREIDHICETLKTRDINKLHEGTIDVETNVGEAEIILLIKDYIIS